MVRFLHAVVVGGWALLLGLLLLPYCPPSLPIVEDPQNVWQRTVAQDLSHRERVIDEELARMKSKVEWAGAYHVGDGLGFNVTIRIAPRTGFVFTHYGCLGLYRAATGSVEERDGVLRFTADSTVGLGGFDPPSKSRDLAFLHFGDRRYLVPVDAIGEFCGMDEDEAGRNYLTRFLVNEDDESRSAKGGPHVPARFRKICERGRSDRPLDP